MDCRRLTAKLDTISCGGWAGRDTHDDGDAALGCSLGCYPALTAAEGGAPAASKLHLRPKFNVHGQGWAGSLDTVIVRADQSPSLFCQGFPHPPNIPP